MSTSGFVIVAVPVVIVAVVANEIVVVVDIYELIK
jgi:hypothetical protein